MPLIDLLRNYIEAEMKVNELLKRKYNPEKMNQCEAYVNDEARKHLKGRSGAIEDSTVFGWAISFFVDDVVIQEDKKIIPSVKKEKGHAVNDKQLSFKF